jgi:nitrate reductase gamma subunit
MTIHDWIDFAKGPLFAFTFLIMILGLLRHVIIQVFSLITGKGRRLRSAPWRRIFADALSWVVPIRHLTKGTVTFSSISWLFHIGILAVPLFLADHIALWESLLKINLPALGRGVADFLTLFTIAAILVLLGFRTFGGRQRAMSRRIDYVLLIMILLPFASGYCAGHPGVNPVSWEVAMLFHLLSAELLFVIVPFTKLAHIVLFFFDRVSGLHWQLRPGAGDKVAHALFGEEARV